LIVGSTGSGKTVTEAWIATRAIDAGLSAVVVDPKGDARMRGHLASAAHHAGRQFFEWTPWGPSVYNPFGHGSASEIADKALAGERFTEPHYQRQAQRYLGHVVRALRGAGIDVSLPALVQQLDPARLEVLSRSLPEPHAKATYDYLDSLTGRQRADLGGVRDRLAIMAESDVAAWLDPTTPGAQTFDLLSAIEQRAVVYFALQADAWPLLAQMLGVAIVQDLQTTMASLQRTPIATLVVIDEFAAVAAERVVHLFGRARSAGINLLLGTQELSDLRLDGHKQLLEQVLGNLSSLVVHRQVVPESAELIARLAGSRGAWRSSQSSDGRWTRTRSNAPLLAPEDVRGLSPGRAAVIEMANNASPRIVEVFSSIPQTTRRSIT
jgi:conjugal transfer pilus assembly protein TraD